MIERDLVDALARALVHFVWQGAMIALAAGAADTLLQRARPQARYVLHAAAFGAMALVFVVTFALGLARTPSPVSFQSLPAVAEAVPAPVTTAPAVRSVDWVGALVLLWLAGVSFSSVRAAGGFLVARRMMRRGVVPAGERWVRAASALCARLGIPGHVRILTSSAVATPAVLGWLRPVVLLPASTLIALAPDQLEMILAHELAHVKRRDYLVNLVQVGVETLLFYHPAVWWVSGCIRHEREHCCDDLAVAACGDRARYARALAALDGLATGHPVAMAANGGSLLARIERLAGRSRRGASAPSWLGAALTASIVLAVVLAASWPAATAGDPPPKPKAKAPASGFLGGLAEAGYTDLSVEDIIALKEHGVDPAEIKAMVGAGLGRPGVKDLIRLHEHGVGPEFVRAVSSGGLVADLDVDTAIRLREHGVDPGTMKRIRDLGFGPYAAAEAIRLHENGADASSFEVLREIGMTKASAGDAIEVRQNGITLARVRDMKRQGFDHLTLEQIVKLARGGVI